MTSLLALPAEAGVIQISNATGSFTLNSQPLGNIFSTPLPYLSTSDLASAHTLLNAWGITTDGHITILPIDSASGLSFLTLIDQELGAGDIGIDASLGLTSTAPSTLGMYINDYTHDTWSLIQPPFGSQTMGATFTWSGMTSGDGFAWTGLSVGDAVSYSFVDLDGGGGAIAPEAFQFVGWNNNGWEVLSTNGFKVDGSSVFTGSVIPAPPAALLITTCMLGLRRRRR